MRLVTKRVHMNKCSDTKEQQITVDKDFNVPDAKPDVASVMKEQGRIEIEEARLVAGKARIEGTLHFQLLYTPEEGGICQMTGTIPFDESISMPEAGENDEIKVEATIEDLRSQIINSRKLGIRGILAFEVCAETICDSEAAVEIEEGDHVFEKTRTFPVSRLVASKKDTLRVRDEWKVPVTSDGVGEILYSDFTLGEMDIRVLNDEIQVDGQCSFFAIYAGDGEEKSLNCFDKSFEISGRIPCNGCEEDMVARVVPQIHTSDVAIKEDEDGESRLLEVEVVVEFDIKIYGSETLELLTDFYSTKGKCQPIYEQSFFQNLLLQNKNRFRVNGNMQTVEGKPPREIWDVSGALRIDKKQPLDTGLQIEGAIDVQVLYRTEGNGVPLATAKGSIPFSQLIEAEDLDEMSVIDLMGALEQINASVMGENEIEIKAVIGFQLMVFRKIEEPMISDFHWEEVDWKEKAKEPAMVGYMLQDGEELWDIAKRFFTTVEHLEQINHLEEREAKSGDMILVVTPRNC